MHGRSPLCRRDAAAGSLHSGHSSAWPPRSPRLMGIHVGSSPSPWHPGCRQELPALFPAFAAKRPPAPCECPAPASAGTSPAPTALEGLRNGAGVAFAPPQPHCPTLGLMRLGRGAGGGAGCPHPAAGDGHPSLKGDSLAQPKQAGWECRGGLYPNFGCGPIMEWGARTATPCQGAARGTDPTDGGSPAHMGMAAPYPLPGLPVKAVGGCHARQEPPLPRSLVLPGQELPAAALSPWDHCTRSPRGAGGPHTPWGAAPGPPLLGTPPGRCCDLQHVTAPEPRRGISTVPGYRVSVRADGISTGACGIAALCSAAERGDGTAWLAPVSHPAPSPGPAGGCRAAAGGTGSKRFWG